MEDYIQKLCDLISHSDTDVVLQYIERQKINARTFHEVSKTCICPSPLGLAIKHGHLLVVNELISLGFDPGAPCTLDNVTWLPLHLACANNESEIILSLHYDHGIDLDSVDTDGYTALVRTILYSRSEKTIDVVKTLVQAGASVNSSLPSGRTPLFASILTGRIDVCRYLILKGADINIYVRNVDRKNITYLMYAIKQRVDIEIVRLLVGSGSDINASDDTNTSSLIYAVDRNVKIDVVTLSMISDDQRKPCSNADVIQFLLESGADVNASDKENKSPLIHASDGNVGIDAIRLLLEYGADVNALDKDSMSPLCHIFESCHSKDDDIAMEETVKLLVKSGADVNSVDTDEATPLMYALQNNAHIDVIRLLLDSAAVVTALDSPLSYAFENPANIDVIKLLIESGADVNFLNNAMVSILMFALTKKANIEVIKLLIDSGAVVNGFNIDDMSSLMYAIKNSAEFDVIKLLIESGADVNLLNNNLISPLMYALENKANIEVIRLLVDSGADVNAIGNGNKSPLMYATENAGETDVIKLLIESGADVNLLNNDLISPLMYALENKANIEVIRLLVESGADVTMLDKYKTSPLHYALENYEINILNIVAYLLDSGADVNTLDTRKRSPLMCALIICDDVKLEDRVNLLRLLLESGADVNTLDSEGKSPLHYALGYGRQSEEMDKIQLLMNSGAEVNILDEGQMSPLLYALKCRASPDVLLLFLKAGADVCATDSDGISPLDYVLGHFDDFKCMRREAVGSINLAQVVLEYVTDMKGLFVKLPDTHDLHEAFGVVRTLCSKGSVHEAKDESGNTVLHHVMLYIRRCSCTRSFNLIHVLIVELNLSLWARNTANETPFLWALVFNEDDVTDFRREIASKILKLCLQVGYIPDSEEMAVVRKIENRDSMAIRGRDVTSLRDICCFSVRRVLGRRLQTAVNSLYIPEKLKQLIKLKHVYPMDVPPANSYDCDPESDDDY